MQDFLAAILAFPTVIFTVMLGGVILYWLTVIFGFFDLDFLDGVLGLESADSAIDGALESVDGAIDGALEGGAEGLEEAASSRAGGLAALLAVLGLQGVPITVVGSFVILWAWMLTTLGVTFTSKYLASGLYGMTAGAALAVIALGVSFLIGSLSVKPFKRLFVNPVAPSRSSLVGKVCIIRSLNVNDRHGQAEIDDGGTGFLAEVRCFKANELTRGSKALVFKYDPADEVFQIAPIDDALAEASEWSGD